MKPPFLFRLLVVVPMSLAFYVVLVVLVPVIPIAILFGEWKYKGKAWK